MAALTTVRSGDWNNTTAGVTPWTALTGSGVGGVAGAGDTVTINNGHTLTVPVGYTAVCGTSPADDTATEAIKCASGGTGILVVNGTLQWRGTVQQADATWTVNAGGRLLYDASAASVPASALYSWRISDASSQTNAKLVLSGSSGSHVTVDSVGNVQSGGFGNVAVGWTGGGRVEATFADISYMGRAIASSSDGFWLKANQASSIILDDCVLDHCGFLWASNMTATGTFRIRRTKITNPANSSYTMQLYAATAVTSGARQIYNSDIAGKIYVEAIGAASNGIDFKHTIIRSLGTQSPLQCTSGAACSSWDQMIVTTLGETDNVHQLPSGTLTNTYLYRQASTGAANQHPTQMNTVGANITIDGWICHYTGPDTNSDILQPLGTEASSARTVTVVRNIFLANAAGGSIGSQVNDSSGDNRTNTKFSFDHNTIIGGESGGNVFGIGAEAGGTWPADTVTSIRSNIKYRATSGVGLIAQSTGATITNAVQTADYNNAFNVTGTIYDGSPTQFHATPGTHDLAVDPTFVDSTRSLLSFDQGYGGAAVGTAWATSTSYAVGDIRSSATSTFYGNATYNFRCISAHTSSSTNKPGSGTAWAEIWEPAGLKTISDSIIAGTTFQAGVNSMIGELVAWNKTGFAPTNVLLNNAGHDSVTIGAVAYQAPIVPKVWQLAPVGTSPAQVASMVHELSSV